MSIDPSFNFFCLASTGSTYGFKFSTVALLSHSHNEPSRIGEGERFTARAYRFEVFLNNYSQNKITPLLNELQLKLVFLMKESFLL